MFQASRDGSHTSTSARTWSRTTLSPRAKRMRMRRIATASTGRRSSTPSSTATGRCSGSRKRTASAKPRSEPGCRKSAGSAWSAPSRCRRGGAREPGRAERKAGEAQTVSPAADGAAAVPGAGRQVDGDREAHGSNAKRRGDGERGRRRARRAQPRGAGAALRQARRARRGGEARRAGQHARERQGDERRCGQTPPGSCAPP